ncbi:MAG TPA: peptidase M6 immune inhibitor A [Micromonosporaceae bacterium]|nr:peptidase M6 immune inhibitor A [Micromonosporaceae bacterium]
MARRRIVGAAATALSLPLLLLVPASANASTSAAAAAAVAPTTQSDIRELSRTKFAFNGKVVELPKRYEPRVGARAATAAVETPPVGTVRLLPALDDFQGIIYIKEYTLRGVGENIEVWVANDLAFPAGDCRGADSTVVTDQQVADLITEFDTNIYPKQTEAFSTPPNRDGTNQTFPLPGFDFTGAGNRTVTLVDNVRDDNFYDFPAASTYIAGFHFSVFNEWMDRNVMTIDAYDWVHRTGANPPDEPTDDPCTSRPARPRLYEGVFAHEWQHLQHYYTDPLESTWMNEGLSDVAQVLVGYVDGNATVFDPGADSHLYCFQGFGIVQTPFNPNPRDCGGPENSLNLWNEGEPAEVLADYGHAFSLLLYLMDKYGLDIITRLHNDGERQGLASLDAALEAEGTSDMYRVLHDHQSMVLLDKIIGDSRFGTVVGISRDRITTPSLRSTVNLANPDAFDEPGAAPNGADYVRLVNANGKPLRGLDLRSLKFNGAATLPTIPLAWTIVDNDPDRPGNPVLFSGNVSNLDVAAITEVSVPASDPTLTFLAKYGAETDFDFGYVIVSTDGGATYTAIAGDKTVPGPLGPGLTGQTDGFEPHTFDLSAYAGQEILLGFRYVSDPLFNEGGLMVDDVMVGGTLISDGSSLDPFDSPTEIRPIPVDWHVKLIGYSESLAIGLQVSFDGKRNISLNLLELLPFLLFPNVVAVVAYDEPTEEVSQYAPYTLTVNGVTQPGGSAS